ncbi:MAG: kinase [Phenylobacterium sp.]|uniref:kinase n=1 Tax=Phenylobacterium sp. TaxID=1871053 RepID=UPI0027193071|nr:kinase [Phenylobacterium sp.]MDO8902162.1 kinase [Phenylobacterium sp.]
MLGGDDWIAAFLREEGLPSVYRASISAVAEPLAQRLQAFCAGRRGPLVVGMCGAQGSGKSSLTAALRRLMARRGLRVAVISLDDLYLTHDQRAALARDVHPLLAVRGPPGTHDIGAGLALMDDLAQPLEVALPRFDKGTDDPRPTALWPRFLGPAHIILLEGWCVGAQAQPEAQLVQAVNSLEADQDPNGVWRRYVNDALAGPYQTLFGQIDYLILLRAPGFEVVADWREEQESKLRTLGPVHAARAMSADQVRSFVQLYERLTRHMLDTLPERADLLIELGPDRTMRLAGPTWRVP